ncbi:MAG TPA: S-methyl-5'-thioadenosine phosphorylase [Candidatus Limnocylindrales bacterium]|nr:S-methyl-5'-thioadenosine phosphorylase [Candidatus Limnocylindrales bacterium]
MRDPVQIGVIGGSGLYSMPEISHVETIEIDTPFGTPSSPIIIGRLRGRRVAFLARHGIGHVFTPSTVPYRANIYALKQLGVRKLVAVNACGSLREDYAPGEVVIPDQLLDYTKDDRGRSFFGPGLVAHVSAASPFCTRLNAQAASAVRAAGGTAHEGGVYVTIEGPRFSTRGESEIFRKLGCSIIGMTTCPEAFLAREAEMCYTSLSHVTDYDVWHTSAGSVTVEMVMQIMHHNLTLAQQALAGLIETLDAAEDCDCQHALDNAVMTSRSAMDADTLERLRPIVGRLFPRP